MSTKIKIWILTLACLGLVLTRAVGIDVCSWVKGGEGGTVNLPLAASTSSVSGTNSSGADGKYRVGYKMPEIAAGLKLVLPSNMSSATAVFTTQGVVVTATSHSGSIHFSGEDLISTRDGGVSSFEMTLVSPENTVLEIVVRLTPNESSYEVIVR